MGPSSISVPDSALSAEREQPHIEARQLPVRCSLGSLFSGR